MNASSLPDPLQQTDGLSLFEPPPPVPADPPALWCPLDLRDLLRVEGADAETFLQGQLTQDVARLREDRVLYAAHCSPKGRVTALFRVWRDQDGFLLDLPSGQGAAAQRRLAMYVLRAKVTLRDARAEWQRTGVAGAAMAAVLAAGGLTPPGQAGFLSRDGARSCLCLGGSRWLVVSPAADDGGVRSRLAALGPADPDAWRLASLRAGEPEVLASTVDAFIPQMLNLDTLDGISFKKGCYTGQEIVARTHYLGKVKRRMRRFGYVGSQAPVAGSLIAIAGPSAPAVSDAAERDAGPAQAQLVWSVATHAGGGEALAVAVAPAEA